MQPITRIVSRVVPLAIDDIDTDQIIPARFLKGTVKTGLGQRLFYDWRTDGAGATKTDFVLERPEMAGRSVLLAGDNFGCGSSREHAPWALRDWGFRAIIARSFADIFRGNALKNGLLPIQVEGGVHGDLVALVTKDPAVEVSIDLATQTLTIPGSAPVTFPVDDFSKHCLLNGIDELGYILSLSERIDSYETAR